MGFFTDLKQDLSQAVDEMADGDNGDGKVVQNPEDEKVESTDASDNSGSDMSPKSNIDDVDLAAMLDKVAGNGETADSEIDKLTADKNDDIPDIPPEVTGDGIGVAVDETQADSGKEDFSDTSSKVYSSEEQSFAEKISEEKAVEEQTPEEQDQDIIVKDKGYNKKGKEKMSDASDEKMTHVDETASVTAGMTINGDVKSAGSLDLIGMITGNIDILGKLNVTGTITGDSKAAEIYAEGAKITGELRSDGSVKIGQSTVIIGNVFATSAVIAGAVKGDIDVQGPVILDTSAIVMGNIKSKSVQINNGAVIEGMCSQCYADVNPSSFFEEFKKK